MGHINKRVNNPIESKKKKQQVQSLLDSQELALYNDEVNLDLTDLVMSQVEEIEILKIKIQNLESGGK